jgi:hypothetical protein
LGRYLLERNIAACFKKAGGQAVEAVDRQEPAGLSLMLEVGPALCSRLLGLLLPHITCRRQHRLVALVAIEGVRRGKGRMALRHAAFEGPEFRDCRAMTASALAGQHIDWAHVPSSEVVSRSAGLWYLCCRRPQASGVVQDDCEQGCRPWDRWV